MTLPKEIGGFAIIGYVWVTDYKTSLCLAMALRHGLINVARGKMVVANQSTVKDMRKFNCGIMDCLISQPGAVTPHNADARGQKTVGMKEEKAEDASFLSMTIFFDEKKRQIPAFAGMTIFIEGCLLRIDNWTERPDGHGRGNDERKRKILPHSLRSGLKTRSVQNDNFLTTADSRIPRNDILHDIRYEKGKRRTSRIGVRDKFNV